MAIRTGKKTKQRRKTNPVANLKKYRGVTEASFTEMRDLLAYKAITKDQDHFLVLKDESDGYAELLSIRGQGVGTMSLPQQASILEGFHHFLQAALDDMKIIISPFPIDTTEQQSYWGTRYGIVANAVRRESNPRRKLQLQTQLRYIRVKQRQNLAVEKALISEEFVLILFGKRKIDLRNKREAVMAWGGKSLVMEPLSLKKKKEVLYRINNLNTSIK